MKRLLVFPTYVPELRRAGDELIYVTDPSPEVHITMGALCLLLELPDRAIEVADTEIGFYHESHYIKSM